MKCADIILNRDIILILWRSFGVAWHAMADEDKVPLMKHLDLQVGSHIEGSFSKLYF